jgi:hypothetical protein
VASRTLESLACAYCPAAPSVRALPVLLQLPRLRRLDLRKSMAEVCPSCGDKAMVFDVLASSLSLVP